VKKFAAAAIASTFTSLKEPSMLEPEDLQQIVAALEELDWVRFVKQQMDAQPDPNRDPDADPELDSPQRHALGDGEVIRYRKLAAEFATLKQAHETLRRSAEQLERESADARREGRLERLAATLAIDLEAEKTRCLYSLGATLSDEQFEQRVDLIAQYAQNLPLGRALPSGVEAASPDRHSQDLTTKAVAYADEQRRQGQPVDWQTAIERVK